MALPAVSTKAAPVAKPANLLPVHHGPERELPWKAAPAAKARLSPIVDHRPDVARTNFPDPKAGTVGARMHTTGVAGAVQPGATLSPRRP
eukprot:7209465-Heterocapsa_arctica.AAC.1